MIADISGSYIRLKLGEEAYVCVYVYIITLATAPDITMLTCCHGGGQNTECHTS